MFKKITIISVLLILCLFALFANSGDKLVLLTSVQTVIPHFSIKGSFDSAFKDAQIGTQLGTILYSESDVSDTSKFHAETLYISVYQENESKYKGSFNLSVSATALEKDSSNKTDPPNWFLQDLTSNELIEVNIPGGIPYGTQKINTTITYKTGAPIESKTSLFSIAFSWRSKANLEFGSYSSTIQLTYTAM